MNQFLLIPDEIPDKEVKIIRNGEKNLKKGISIFLHSKLTLEDLEKICKKKLKMNSIRRFRLFTEDGVELQNEDLQLIPYNSSLYASQGEDYDCYSQFSQYKKMKVIGEGGFGQVVLGEHRITKQKVAIKFVENMMNSASDIDQIYKESETMKNLSHKNIVEIYQTYTLKNMQTVLIMEYLEGGELLDLLEQKGRLSEEEAREYFSQMVDAMQYCHNEKLIHRDLKPENIMLAKKGSKQIKIVDFGIAGVSSNFKLDKINIGSLKYMAPEVLSNKIDKIGPSIDIWALGVILYAMICNQLPFDGPNPKSIASKIIIGKYTFPEDIEPYLSPYFKELLEQILQPNVSLRATLKDIKDSDWMTKNLSTFTFKNIKPNKFNSMKTGITRGFTNSGKKLGFGMGGAGDLAQKSNLSKNVALAANPIAPKVVQPVAQNNMKNQKLSVTLESINENQVKNQDGINPIQTNQKNINKTTDPVKQISYNPNKTQPIGNRSRSPNSFRIQQSKTLTRNQRSQSPNVLRNVSPPSIKHTEFQILEDESDMLEEKQEDMVQSRFYPFRNFTNLTALPDPNKVHSPEKSKSYLIKKFNLNPMYVFPSKAREQSFKARSHSPKTRLNEKIPFFKQLDIKVSEK